MASSLMKLRTVAWPSLRRGSRLTSGDELADGRAAVADHVGRLAQGGGDQPVADDQQAVVGAGDEASRR